MGGYIIRYIRQEEIDRAERWLERPLRAEEVEAKKLEVRVETLGGAERLVSHLRATGCIASFYEEHEL